MSAYGMALLSLVSSVGAGFNYNVWLTEPKPTVSLIMKHELVKIEEMYVSWLDGEGNISVHLGKRVGEEIIQAKCIHTCMDRVTIKEKQHHLNSIYYILIPENMYMSEC